MRLKPFKNDKSTRKDELFPLVFIAVCSLAGAALLITRPSFWIIGQEMTMSFGLMMLLTGIMYIPGLLYRFFTNDRDK